MGWTWDAGRYSNASSWVEPYNHPSLETLAATDSASTLICIRERANTSPAVGSAVQQLPDRIAFDRLQREVSSWPLDFILVCIEDGHVRILAGSWGTAPIYITVNGDTIVGSWRITDLAQRIDRRQFLDREVARLLTLRHRYSSDTIFPDIHRLTERAEATLSSGGLEIRYPEPAQHALPRKLRPGTDVLDFYEKSLAGSIQARHFDPAEVVIELSGGLDSTNVAMTLHRLYPTRILSYALMIGGLAGKQQQHRRQAVVDRCGFDDHQVQLLDNLPFGQAGPPEPPVAAPYDEPYLAAFSKLLGLARHTGARVAMTGIGGDELVAPYATEAEIPAAITSARTPLPEWLGPRTLRAFGEIDDGIAPGATAAESSLLATACRAPAFLDAGIWPISPFCAPLLIRFAESLPYE